MTNKEIEKKEGKEELYDDRILKAISSFFVKESKNILEILGVGVLIGAFMQLYYLTKFDATIFFSWNQAINDGTLAIIMIILFYLVFHGTLSIYKRYKRRGLLSFLILLLILVGKIYFNLPNSTMVFFMPIIFGIFISSVLFFKSQEWGTPISSLLLLGAILYGGIRILEIPNSLVKQYNVYINNEKYNIEYMNDIVVITNSGIFNRGDIQSFENKFTSVNTGNNKITSSQ